MPSSNQGSLRVICNRIDDAFAEEMGPVADLLCEEAFNAWRAELDAQKVAPSLRSLHAYVDRLASQIDSPDSRKSFLDRVYSIEALSVFDPRSR